MTVETKNASLSTLSVTINALHVNGKQMTLAVFKQLPIASLVRPDGTKDIGLSWWGSVRYKIKDEGDLWMVANTIGRCSDGRLYRCPKIKPFDEQRWLDGSKAEIEGYKSKLSSSPNNQFYADQLKKEEGFYVRCMKRKMYWDKAQIVMQEWNRYPQLFIAV